MNFNPGDHIAIRGQRDSAIRTVTHVSLSTNERDVVHYECEWADGAIHSGRAASIDVWLERQATDYVAAVAAHIADISRDDVIDLR